MSFTYGFYNAVNHDRVYDARQLGAIFDGIINDGVYESQGERFMVRPASSGMAVTVASGRAWFDHTWNYNDSLLPLTLAMSDVLLNRIDAVVIETNTSSAVRSNSIKVITGIPAENPSRPTMEHSEFINQYPLAYILVPANTTKVLAGNITNAVGTSACPYVTGILQVTNIDNLVAQWQAQWEEWSEDQKIQVIAWIKSQKNEFLLWVSGFETDAVAWRATERARWEAWFRNIQYVLDGDAAGHLQVEIDQLNEELHRDMNSFEDEVIFRNSYPMSNSHYDFIKDPSSGSVIEIHATNTDLSTTSIISFDKGVNTDIITERVEYKGYTYIHIIEFDKTDNTINESYRKEVIT